MIKEGCLMIVSLMYGISISLAPHNAIGREDPVPEGACDSISTFVIDIVVLEMMSLELLDVLWELRVVKAARTTRRVS